MKQSSSIFEKIIPFLVLGVSIAFFIAVVILFSYLFLWGLALGLVLFAISYVWNAFSPPKQKDKEKQGRIIEHEDDK